MFATFPATAAHAPESEQIDAASASSFVPGRSKRQQVSKACSWCRTYRIKCDDRVPCRNCVIKGRQCTEKGAKEVRTFSLALRFVLKDLEVPDLAHP